MPDGVTVVLGGVGIRGIANIGVLKVLREQKVPIKRIVATGVNAVIAAHFGLGRDLDSLTERFTAFFAENHRYMWGLERLSGIPREAARREAGSIDYFLRQRLFCAVNMRRVSVLPGELVEDNLKVLFGDLTTDDLAIPVAICAIDLSTQEEVLLSGGLLRELVRVGIAFPGLFPPARMEGREYVSSVLYCELPLGRLTEADAPILAVDLPQVAGKHKPKSLLEVLARADEVRSQAVKEQLLEKKADIVIRLDGIRRFPWGGYRRIPQLIARAQEEFAEKLPHALAGITPPVLEES
ncbi:patatin-like phospholipase family protein [Candidatus Bipolaricaulota bacterium]|nr:patatin-like phospholipase family protein [Candidatus Bipolaricaulota bacterium]